MPEYFTNFLTGYPNATLNFDRFSYLQKKEYVEWIIDAKTEATRQKRMETAAEWIAEGKSMHWKYKFNKRWLNSPVLCGCGHLNP